MSVVGWAGEIEKQHFESSSYNQIEGLLWKNSEFILKTKEINNFWRGGMILKGWPLIIWGCGAKRKKIRLDPLRKKKNNRSEGRPKKTKKQQQQLKKKIKRSAPGWLKNNNKTIRS